jgi:hypothetical protein
MDRPDEWCGSRRPWLGIGRALALSFLMATSAFGQDTSPRPPAPSTPASQPPRTADTPATQPPPVSDTPRGAGLPPLPGNVAGGLGRALPLPLPAGSSDGRTGSPGAPRSGGRPRPGGIFDPGAAGPGISQSGNQNFLDGALDPRTGWPFVFLDHFRPRPERVEAFWVVSTRDCTQELGSDPWPRMRVRHFDESGDLVERDFEEMFAQAAGRPVLIQVQGSLVTPDIALGGLLWSHSWLQANRAITPDAVVIAFDWPSQRVYRNDVLDVNEKGRRALIAAYHLAEFVQEFPPSSRICLLGQSYGGRVVPGALHLLGGGQLGHQRVCLPTLRPDLDLRAVIIAGASDRTWLDPGQKFDRALHAANGFLNLYNTRDESLLLYPGLIRSGHHRALGRLGLSNRDFDKLGPLAARYEEHDINDILGSEHSLLDATANPRIGRWIAPYAWAPDPGPSPRQAETDPTPYGGSNNNRVRRFEINRGGSSR